MTPFIPFIVETEKQYFKEVLDRLEIDFPKLPFFPSLTVLDEFVLRVHVKIMLQRELIRAEVNAGEFLKSILNVGDFTRKYKCNHYFISPGDSRSIPRNWNWPEMWCKSFCTLTFHTVKNDNQCLFTAGIRN